MKKNPINLQTLVAIIAIFTFITGISALPDIFRGENESNETSLPTQIPHIDIVNSDSSTGEEQRPDNYDKSNEAVEYLSDLEPIDGEIEFENGVVKDIYNNTYDSYFSIFLAEFPEYYIERSVEYAVNKNYRIFSGTLFTDKDEGIDSAYRMRVYADDIRVFKSPVMKKKSQPENFEIPIEGVDCVKIVFDFIDGNSKGMVDGFYKNTRAGLNDAKFIS